jgi:hypothetical protein
MASRLFIIVVSLTLAMSLVGCGEDVPTSVRMQADLVRSAPANRFVFSSPMDFDEYTEALMWLSDDPVVGDKATKYLAEVYNECSYGGRVVIKIPSRQQNGRLDVTVATTLDGDYVPSQKLYLLQKLYAPQSAEMTIGTRIGYMRTRMPLFMKLRPDPSIHPNDPWFGTARSLGLDPNTN